MCLLTITPEPKTKSTSPPNRIITDPKPTPAEPSQPTPLPPHYVTCPGNTKDNNKDTKDTTTKQPMKETGRVTENELLHLLLASQREKCQQSQNQKQDPPPSQSQSQQRTPAPPPPPPPVLRPREEHHYHHYGPAPRSPLGRLGRRRSSASSSSGVSVRSFESVRRRVGGLFQRVGVLERDRERREWLAEAAEEAAKAAAAGQARRERSRSRSRSRGRGWGWGERPVVGVGGVERWPDYYGRGRPVRECRKEERFRQW